jgi:hypothetical protein
VAKTLGQEFSIDLRRLSALVTESSRCQPTFPARNDTCPTGLRSDIKFADAVAMGHVTLGSEIATKCGVSLHRIQPAQVRVHKHRCLMRE